MIPNRFVFLLVCLPPSIEALIGQPWVVRQLVQAIIRWPRNLWGSTMLENVWKVISMFYITIDGTLIKVQVRIRLQTAATDDMTLRQSQWYVVMSLQSCFGQTGDRAVFHLVLNVPWDNIFFFWVRFKEAFQRVGGTINLRSDDTSSAILWRVVVQRVANWRYFIEIHRNQ